MQSLSLKVKFSYFDIDAILGVSMEIRSLFGDMAYLLDFPRSIIYPAVLMLLLTAFSPKYIYAGWKLYRALERGGELPQRLSEFPAHPTSIEKYLDVKERIEQFKRQVLKGESSQIILSSGDLNDLYLQGTPINKYYVSWQAVSVGVSYFKYNNSYTSFEITDTSVLQKQIRYIDYAMNDGISSSTDEIEFSKSADMISIRSRMTEINGKKPFKFVQDSSVKEYSIRSSSLLENILRCNFEFSISYLESNEHQLILSVIDKLTQVEVANGYLRIESNVLSGNDRTEIL
jgi:hypothetical protein